MLTKELTDRKLLEWLDDQITKRREALGCLSADERFVASSFDEAGVERQRCRGQEIESLTSLRNNLRLGLRCIDGQLDLGERPWSEEDADAEGNTRTPVAGYVTDATAILYEACLTQAAGLENDRKRRRHDSDLPERCFRRAEILRDAIRRALNRSPLEQRQDEMTLRPPAPWSEVIRYVTGLMDQGFLFYVGRQRDYIDAVIVEPSSQFRVGYLTAGNSCVSCGLPSIRPHIPTRCDEIYTTGYLLTAADWEAVALDIATQREAGALCNYSLSVTPWREEATA